MTISLRRVAGLIGFVLILAALSPPQAQAAKFGRTLQCNVFGVAPPAPTLTSSLRKFSYARAGVTCPPFVPNVPVPQTVVVEFKLMGEDAVFDDVVRSVRTHTITVPGTNLLSILPTFGDSAILGARSACNEDAPGADELYSRVRARIDTPDPQNGFWSSWTNSKTVTYDCS